ncbi:MAG: hypothetical protein IJ412_04785 [Oscillospiraceae bacterium]|nr:hypothetical protein [Oscillospiraceae bacterium]
MSRYKISWRTCPEGTVKAKDLSPEEFDEMLELLCAEDSVADEIWVILAEPTNYCYEPLESIAKKCGIFEKYAASAHKRGLRIGVNPWPTFGAEEPRLVDKYPREMPFRPMVSSNGVVSKRSACPIGPEFLEWSKERYRMFARTGADMVWVDDDCRLTHLGSLQHYPCFCPDCVKGFENGAFADRESLVSALNAPENGDLRRKWCAWGAKRLATWCAAVREAVDEVDPAIETPFMSVGYSHTTFSGNYIEECMKALRAKSGRPGHGFYWDEAPLGMFEKVIEMSRQIVDMPDTVTDIQYEEESFPYAPLNKAVETRLLEMALSVWGGCTGIAMNHMYHAGGPRPFDYLQYEVKQLRAARGFFDRYLTFAENLPQSGIWAAYTQWMMAGMKVDENGWFNEDDPSYNSVKFVNEWPGYGIPVTCDPAHSYATLLQGKMAEVLTDAELEKIFEKPVILDGLALQCLWERGWGEKTGVRITGSHVGGNEWLSDHAWNGEFAASTRTALFDVAYALEPVCEGVEILGYTHRPLGEPDEITITRYNNIIVMGYDPYRFTGTPGHMTMMRNMIKALGAAVYLEPADPYAMPRVSTWARADDTRAAVLLINPQTSPALDFDVCFKSNAQKATAIGLGRDDQSLDVRYEDGFLKARISRMEPWEMRVILFE